MIYFMSKFNTIKIRFTLQSKPNRWQINGSSILNKLSGIINISLVNWMDIWEEKRMKKLRKGQF